MDFRYMGFEQLRNARAFRFVVVAKGDITRQAVVTADMALFLHFRVAIQEGPSLCAGKLAADYARSFEGEHILTGDDLRAFSEARTAADEKRAQMRGLAGRRHTKPVAAFGNPRGRLES
jgi:hypothetical protein